VRSLPGFNNLIFTRANQPSGGPHASLAALGLKADAVDYVGAHEQHSILAQIQNAVGGKALDSAITPRYVRAITDTASAGDIPPHENGTAAA